MGVEYYSCKCCGNARYEEYVGSCTSCNSSLCTACLINDDVDSNFASHYGVVFDGSKEMMDEFNITQEEIDKGYVVLDEIIDDTSIAPKYCPYCSGNEIDSDKFNQWLIDRTGKSREELEQLYLKESN